MNTVIMGISGGGPFEIMLTCLSAKEDSSLTALLTVRQKDTDLGIKELEKLGKACLAAAKMLRRRKGK